VPGLNKRTRAAPRLRPATTKAQGLLLGPTEFRLTAALIWRNDFGIAWPLRLVNSSAATKPSRRERTHYDHTGVGG